MSLLDVFFKIAVPFVVLTMVFAGFALRYDRTRGIYRGEEGASRRDQINRRYRTNTGAVVIGILFLGVWGLLVAGLIEQWGAIFFTFVVAALLLLPVGTVAVCVIAVYMFAVHAFARLRNGE
ncbi:MAG: hypothetical protein V2J10_03540 [Wenzhouxiangella sp.]|jgi:hypothetical protein|nr:hypothetical protein [Wenzhouxiangella sp.]